MVKSSVYFPWYFGDLDHVETGVSEKGNKFIEILTEIECIAAVYQSTDL